MDVHHDASGQFPRPITEGGINFGWGRGQRWQCATRRASASELGKISLGGGGATYRRPEIRAEQPEYPSAKCQITFSYFFVLF